jgi:hypothetical protein
MDEAVQQGNKLYQISHFEKVNAMLQSTPQELISSTPQANIHFIVNIIMHIFIHSAILNSGCKWFGFYVIRVSLDIGSSDSFSQLEYSSRY